MKRIVVISDLHCGHRYGLVPPAWQKYTVQIKFWKWFSDNAKKMGKINTLIVNGDAIDGKSPRSGGIELITADRLEQVNMAEECIRQFDAEEVVIICGTPYHTGCDEQFEQVLADKVDGEFHPTLNLHIVDNNQEKKNELIFNFKHALGNSTVPHTKANAIMRARCCNILYGATHENTIAGVVIRSHLHYYIHTGDIYSLGIVTPCLQLSSIYGETKSESPPDVGFIYFDIINKDQYTFQPILLKDKLWKTPKMVR